MRVVFGKALAAVALLLLAAPVGASADTVWTGAGNGTGCIIAHVPERRPRRSGRRSPRRTPRAASGSRSTRTAASSSPTRTTAIKRIRTDGVLQTVAGNGTQCGDAPATPAATAVPRRRRRLAHPIGVAVGPAGDVFIVDYVGRRVRKVRKADGVIQTIAGNGADSVSLHALP